MEQIKKCIGDNLYNFRNKAGLTLQQLSDVSSVSKTMLSGIEKAEMNPSITTLWKIADGLKIPIGWLINEKKQSVDLVRKKECQLTLTAEGYRILTVFPFDPQQNIEVYMKEIDKEMIIKSEGHREGILEYIMVHEGIMELVIDDTMYHLYPGDSIKFSADVHHSYKNISNSKLKAYTIIYYPDSGLN